MTLPAGMVVIADHKDDPPSTVYQLSAEFLPDFVTILRTQQRVVFTSSYPDSAPITVTREQLAWIYGQLTDKTGADKEVSPNSLVFDLKELATMARSLSMCTDVIEELMNGLDAPSQDCRTALANVNAVARKLDRMVKTGRPVGVAPF